MSERAKPLNAKTRESLKVALNTLVDECAYLNDTLAGSTNKSLVERLTTKRDHLIRSGQWIESKLASTEE